MADVDSELRRFRVDFHSIAVGFPEPGSAHKLKMTFLDDFGEEVPYQKFGYMSFDAFLNDHPDLERVMLEGKPCYRAKMSERTAHIQSLVSRQKKKKRKGTANKRGVFQRNVQTRGFQYRPQSPQFNYNNFNQRSFRGGRTNPAPQPCFNRASFSAFPRQPFQFQQYGGNVSGGYGANGSVTPRQSLPPLAPEYGDGPVAGKARIVAALKKCHGKATLTKLNYCYQQLYNTQLDKAEMQKYFTTNNFRAIHVDWLSEDFDLNAGSNGQWVFLSKEIVKRQQYWADAHKNIIVTETPHQRWDKPTLKELFDKVVSMLVNMHPEPIQLSQMAEVYKRAHGVQVDPGELYCKTWEDMVKNTFRDKMTLKPNGSVVLSEKAQREYCLSAKARVPVAAPTSIKRVTAEDLGLEYSDDSESGEDDDDNVSLASNSTFRSRVSALDLLNTSSSLGRGSHDVTANARLTVNASNTDSGNQTAPNAPRVYRSVFGEVFKLNPSIKVPTPAEKSERKSIFSRLTFGGGRKPPVSPLSSVFTDPVVKKSALNHSAAAKDLRIGPDLPLAQYTACSERNTEIPRPSEQPLPVSKETSSGKGFSFMKTIVSRTGFGVKRTEQAADSSVSVFSRIRNQDRTTEAPYDLWNNSSNGIAPSEHPARLDKQHGESDHLSRLGLQPGGFQDTLPDSVLNRLQNIRISRKLPGMRTEMPTTPLSLEGSCSGAPRGLSEA